MEKRYATKEYSDTDRLCENCRILIFNDSTGFSSVESETHGDANAYLKFDSDDVAREFNLHCLGKEMHDFFPNLPNLQIAAARGCEFCLLLRDAALSVDLFNGVEPPLAGSTSGQEPVSISYKYLWREVSLYGSGNQGLSRLLATFSLGTWPLWYLHHNKQPSDQIHGTRETM
jgi:hypothetical protein